MIFPTSFEVGIGLLILSLLCWGSWPSTFQRAGKWRYELFYFDFSAGFLLLALIAAFTFGTMNATELTFRENFLITGYRKMAFAVGAGVLFNIVAGLNNVHVPYKGAGQFVPELVAGRVDSVIGAINSLVPQVKAGKLRALGMAGRENPLLPGVPTLASQVPGVVYQFRLAPSGRRDRHRDAPGQEEAQNHRVFKE